MKIFGWFLLVVGLLLSARTIWILSRGNWLVENNGVLAGEDTRNRLLVWSVIFFAMAAAGALILFRRR